MQIAIQNYGGKISNTISKSTCALIAGLTTIETKLKDAKKHKVPVVNEAGLYKLIEELSANATCASFETTAQAAAVERLQFVTSGISLAE
jgi:BRCT domain type II-containing protein